jgi:hypothetical protein
MDVPNAISSLEEEFNSRCELEFDISYDINCEIYIVHENEKIQFILQVRNYSCKKNTSKIIVNKIFDSIEDALNYLHNIFREDGSLKYSKIVDQLFESEEEMKYEEKIFVAKQVIVKRESECCVCGDINSVFTKCEHNLCRYCFSKMYQVNKCCDEHSEHDRLILCPICKREIY